MFSWSGKRYKGWTAQVKEYSDLHQGYPVIVTDPSGHVFSVKIEKTVFSKKAAKGAIRYWQDQAKPKSPFYAEYNF